MANLTKRVLTPRFRMSFPHLIVPKPYMENGVKKGEPRFQLDMIFEVADLAKFRAEDGNGQLVEIDVKKLAVNLAREQWPAGNPPDKGGDMTLQDSFKAAFLDGAGNPTKSWPFREGDKMADALKAKNKDGEFLRGKVVIAAKSYENVKPILSYYDATAKATKQLSRISDVDMAKAKEMFNGGNYAGAELSMRASCVGGVHYISFYINAVRFLAEGEKFGGKGMMDRFDGVYGGEAAHDPTAGMNEEIPF